MKKLRSISVAACMLLLLGSCSKKESEQTQPETAPDAAVSVPATPPNDLIRKVVRFNNSGTIADSILFKYDSQNRVSRIEFGTFTNGKFKNKIDFVYTTNATGTNVIMERDSALAPNGQYSVNTLATFNVNADYRKATSITIQSPLSYGITYDNSGFVKSVRQSGQKQFDAYQHITFQSQNNNLTESITDSDLAGSNRTTYAYYPEPYLHDLYFNLNEYGMHLFWNGQLSDIFSFRHSFLGQRNTNLVKKETIYFGQSDSTVTSYQYEYNTKALVSRIKTASVSSRNGSTPMATKYEVFYY